METMSNNYDNYSYQMTASDGYDYDYQIAAPDSDSYQFTTSYDYDNQINTQNNKQTKKWLRDKAKELAVHTQDAVSKVLDKTKKLGRKIITWWAIATTLAWWAPEATALLVPQTATAITAAAPITIWTTAALTASLATLTWCDKPDIEAPKVDQKEYSVDIEWSAKIYIRNKQLYIGDKLVADWTAETDVSSVTMYIDKENWQKIESWTNRDQVWTKTLVVVLSDAKWNKNRIYIRLNVTPIVKEAVQWLENIESLSMQVDKEINLLKWVTFSNWTTLDKVEIEIDGKSYTVSDPAHYIPQLPWTCNVKLYVQSEEWPKEYTVNVKNSIKPLEYRAPNIETADVINEHYSWFNNLSKKKKEFIYKQVLISYITWQWCKLDNVEYIIAGEVPKETPCENVGRSNTSDYKTHADQALYNYECMAPWSTVKAAWWNREHIEPYISQHPEKTFFISCASHKLWGKDQEMLQNNKNYASLKAILDYENTVTNISVSNMDTNQWWDIITINESTPPILQWFYNSASVNSEKNNKYTISWFNASLDNNILGENNFSCIPRWFTKDTKNIVIPFVELVGYQDNHPELTSTTSSFPTSIRTATISNDIQVVMSNNPWYTAEDANTVIINDYLQEDTFKYKDQNDWNIKDWGARNFFQDDKFINNEMLHKPEIDAIKLENEDTPLPSGKWIYYEWKWIQFEYKWKRYNLSDSMWTTAVTSWEDIQYYFNTTLDIKSWWKWTTSFNVGILDKNGKKIPDIQLKNVTKTYKY